MMYIALPYAQKDSKTSSKKEEKIEGKGIVIISNEKYESIVLIYHSIDLSNFFEIIYI